MIRLRASSKNINLRQLVVSDRLKKKPMRNQTMIMILQAVFN